MTERRVERHHGEACAGADDLVGIDDDELARLERRRRSPEVSRGARRRAWRRRRAGDRNGGRPGRAAERRARGREARWEGHRPRSRSAPTSRPTRSASRAAPRRRAADWSIAAPSRRPARSRPSRRTRAPGWARAPSAAISTGAPRLMCRATWLRASSRALPTPRERVRDETMSERTSQVCGVVSSMPCRSNQPSTWPTMPSSVCATRWMCRPSTGCPARTRASSARRSASWS